MNLLSSITGPKDLKKYNIQELNMLAKDIRNVIIETVSRNGGHLASNLGVVELTLALHSVFNSPEDKIIWDVGHQAYAHKLLTGRLSSFESLRKYQGLSGFPKIGENEHDVFGAGHSSTSLSAALGMAIERDLLKKDNHVVAVIGDGSLTGGMAWEALNHIGHLGKKVIIIINDNQMSISPNVGALSRYLNGLRTAPYYERTKRNVVTLLNRLPMVGKTISHSLEKIKNSLKYLMVNGVVFEELGFTYIGPIDGHDIAATQVALKQARVASVPVIVHCMTKKGYGYEPAVKCPDYYHGVSPFDIATGQPLKKKRAMTYSNVFGNTLVELAHHNDKITAITAAMTDGVGLQEFAKVHPKKFFDVGIAEQHAVTLAAGMAAAGLKPVVAVYSTFLQRAYDQVLHDIALQNLPVVFAIDRAGLVGADGATHHGVFDISYLKSIPNLTIMTPCNGIELAKMLEYAFNLNSPVAIRYSRGDASTFVHLSKQPIELGKAELLTKGDDVAIWAAGRMVGTAIKCAEVLKKNGINATVINSRFIKPVDTNLLNDIASKLKLLVTLEDNVVAGGLGESIARLLKQSNMNLKIINLGIPDEFIGHGTVLELDSELGLDFESICNMIEKNI